MTKKKLREIVILHSNDIHGNFVGDKDRDGKTVCSLAQLAGYVNKVKSEYPLLNANFMVKKNDRTLFKPSESVTFGRLRVLFIGLLTENIVDQTRAEGLVGTYVTVKDAAEEIRGIVEHEREEGGVLRDYLKEHKGLGGRVDRRIIILDE